MATIISDWHDLDNVRNDYTSNYELANDLDSSTAGYAGIGDNFDCLAPGLREWACDFDGKGYVISEITINDGADWGTAMFGSTTRDYTTTIKNLGVIGTITNSTSNSTGGIVGRQSPENVISNCFSDVNINITSGEVGGFVGTNYGTIDKCYSLGSVTGEPNNPAGGFVGSLFGDITNCYTNGDVGSAKFVGGFVGSVSEYNGSIFNCYSSATIGTAVDKSNGFRGNGSLPSSPSYTYWDTQISGDGSYNGGATGLTTSQMQGSAAATNMAGFDFVNVWETGGYPTLINSPTGEVAVIEDVTASLDSVSLSSNSLSVTATPGAVQSPISSSTLSVSAQSVSAGSVVSAPLDSTAAAIGAGAVTPAVGGVTALLAASDLLVSNSPVQVASGPVSAAVDTPTLQVHPPPISVGTGVTVALNSAELQSTAEPVTPVASGLSVGLTPASLTLSAFPVGLDTWLSDYEYDSFNAPILPYSLTVDDLEEVDTSDLLADPFDGYAAEIEDILNDF